jgi:putative transposase
LDALDWLRKHLEHDEPDLVRDMVRSFAERLMSAEADAMCGAGYGERSAERVNSRNGYRHRDFDTRAGTIDLAVPKLREGSYYPGWLLEPSRRAERALTQVVCQCYVEGVSIRKCRATRCFGRSARVALDTAACRCWRLPGRLGL